MGATEIPTKAVTIENSILISNTRPVWFLDGDNIVKSSIFYKNEGFAALVVCPGAQIINNLFQNNEGQAIREWDCSYDHGTTIRNNTIISNSEIEAAISIGLAGEISFNNMDHRIGLGTFGSKVNNNNLLTNHGTVTIVVGLDHDCNFDATNNWWNTATASEIDAKIEDFNDDFTLDTVIYSPFSNNLISNAGSSILPIQN